MSKLKIHYEKQPGFLARKSKWLKWIERYEDLKKEELKSDLTTHRREFLHFTRHVGKAVRQAPCSKEQAVRWLKVLSLELEKEMKRNG